MWLLRNEKLDLCQAECVSSQPSHQRSDDILSSHVVHVSLAVFIGLMLGSLLLVSLCAGAAAMFDSRLDVHWDMWKKTHEKAYNNEVCGKNTKC